MAVTYPNKLLILVATLAVAACGGGGGGDAGTIVPPSPDDGGDTGGIDRSGIRVLGSITGFGSVIVDGERFDTSSATVEIDDEPGSESDLATGEVVLVAGEIDADGNRIAASLVSDDLLRGPIQTIDPAAETFVVLEQTVVVDVDTAFDDSIAGGGIDGLTAGQAVRVDGFLAPDGSVVATRVDTDDGDDLQIVGTVSNLDTAALTFDIGAQAIDYSAATLEDFDGTVLTDGQVVEVEGNALASGGVLPATKVERVSDDIGADDDDLVEIEGIVTAVPSSGEFAVNGIVVTRDGNTVYERGDAADLIEGARVDVDAVAEAGGVLRATKIEFEPEKIVRIEALVEGVDAAAGSLQTLGITVLVGPDTRLEDDSNLDLRRFTLADINIGDFVEIGGSASETADDEALAALVKRDDDGSDAEVELRARVQAIAAPEFTLLGVTVRTTVDTEFEDGEEVEISPDAFFASAAGRLVEVEGSWDGSILTAEKVEFEVED